MGNLARRLKHLFYVPYACFKLISSRNSYLRQMGWLESFKASKPLSREGTPVPWMNYNVSEFLAERLSDQFDLFEYGSGFSTCFFAKHVAKVASVEYDKDWYEQVRGMVPANATVMFQPIDDSGAYERSISLFGQMFDVIVVDGQHRDRCIDVAIDYLTEAGVIILDDSDRKEYADGKERLVQHGFRHLTLSGMKPGSASRHQATVFYRDQNCLGI